MATALVAMVRDEADIVEAWAQWNARQVDFMVVADNLSADGTREILDGLAGELPLSVVDDPEPAYYQSAKVTRLAHQARQMGAQWIVPADADELWWSPHGRVADVLGRFSQRVGLVLADVHDFVATGVDPCEADPTRRMQWRRAKRLQLPKVACRAVDGLVIHQGNHMATVPGPPLTRHRLSVRHYPYRSLEQLIRKVRNGAAAYAATEGLDPDMGGHWRQWGEFTDEQLCEMFRTWYWRSRPDRAVSIEGEHQPPLVWDPLP